MTASPGCSPLATPLALTLALALEELHVNVAPAIGWSASSYAVAVNWMLEPCVTVPSAGVTATRLTATVPPPHGGIVLLELRGAGAAVLKSAALLLVSVHPLPARNPARVVL